MREQIAGHFFTPKKLKLPRKINGLLSATESAVCVLSQTHHTLACHCSITDTQPLLGENPVAREQRTQYILILCGLGREDFADFPALFQDRFYREAMAICKQAQLYDDHTLAEQLAGLGEEQCYQLDLERIEESPITKVL